MPEREVVSGGGGVEYFEGTLMEWWLVDYLYTVFVCSSAILISSSGPYYGLHK